MRHAHSSRAERQAVDELWLREVSQIPTSYGRLVYLNGLLNPDTGRYEYYGGADEEADSHRSLKKIHELTFREWLGYPLERKMADVQAYIAGLPRVDQAELIDAWLRLTPYKNLVPASVQGPERRKHVSDVEAILGLLKNLYGVASPDPTA